MPNNYRVWGQGPYIFNEGRVSKDEAEQAVSKIMDFIYFCLCVQVCPAPQPFYLLFHIHVRNTLLHPRRICPNSGFFKTATLSPSTNTMGWKPGAQEKIPNHRYSMCEYRSIPFPFLRMGSATKKHAAHKALFSRKTYKRLFVLPHVCFHTFFSQPSSSRFTLTTHSAWNHSTQEERKTMPTCTCH